MERICTWRYGSHIGVPDLEQRNGEHGYQTNSEKVQLFSYGTLIFTFFFQEISKAAGHVSAYTLCCKLAQMTMLTIEIYYSTFIHWLVDLYRVTLVCYETISLTSLPRSNSRSVNLTHHCHYTMVSADSKFDDFVCSVFNLNYKNVNALIARILSGSTCTCSLTVNG